MPINGKTKPVNNFTNKTLFAIDQLRLNRKIDETVSLVLKAHPVVYDQKIQEKDKQIYLFRAPFDNIDGQENIHNENLPDERVLLNFVKAELKEFLLKNSKQSTYLCINFIWRVN